MSPATTELPARERLLRSASELFYAEGVHSVGIDRVIEHAGVAKATLYYAYGSKDGLVRAYLEDRQERRRVRIERHTAACATPRDRVLAVFDALNELIDAPDYRGCPFVNANAELRPDSAAVTVTASARAWLRDYFRTHAAAAGVADPNALADQLGILHDGATVTAQLDHDRRAGAAARVAAAVLLDSAIACSA